METPMKTHLLHYAAERFGHTPEYLWKRFPDYCVLRHSGNRKWYAVLMEVPWRRLGQDREGSVSIVDLKCGPLILGSLLGEPGFLPAYHMSKSSWVTLVLDGSVPAEEMERLLELSYDQTKGKGA